MIINKINPYEWVIPTSASKQMEVPVRIYANQKMIRMAETDESLEQAVHAASLPGLAGEVVVMPDVHQGYGFPIGGVAATCYPDGIISPGAIGYDINCGVRLLSSGVSLDDAEPFLEALAARLDQLCPSGVGSEGAVDLSFKELDQVCRLGSKWALKQGWAEPHDLLHTEENGCLEGADPGFVSARSRERGRSQLGTLGAGNHFIEVDVVDEVFDPSAAAAMHLVCGNLTLQIHCGSRGFGHQVCTDYVQEFQSLIPRLPKPLPDRELVYAPLSSIEGQAYLAAMKAAANFAFCNRQVLAYHARQAFEEVFCEFGREAHLWQVYDLAHNIGKVETHLIGGKSQKVCVHRKGATRAFGPGSRDVPMDYMEIGQPVFVPGSMGSVSWVLAGTEAAMQKTYGSLCHGAGRVMSRHQARKEVRGEQLRTELSGRGIHIRYHSLGGLVEEAPQAYKDVDDVIEVVTAAGLARKVARLKPVIVIKG
jgi:tRNA-splicing ligase RtcB (3'-phosphate/5'-hydroxy nucleic acid ligase)